MFFSDPSGGKALPLAVRRERRRRPSPPRAPRILYDMESSQLRYVISVEVTDNDSGNTLDLSRKERFCFINQSINQ